MRLSKILTFLLIFITGTTTLTHAHNITRLLAEDPSFSTFNQYLTLTHLAYEINSRNTITVCAVDNAEMSKFLSKNPSITTIKNVLSFHVLLDYFGTKQLHQITNGTSLAATLFQTTGSAPGPSGFVNITDMKEGKVALGPEDNDGTLGVFFVKSVEEVPYNISVIQISGILPSQVVLAPAPGPAEMNLTDIMSAHGCKVFGYTLLAFPEASKTYQDTIVGGLTVFCPTDDPMKAFLPRFNNLAAAGKVSFLEFFGVPIYNSLAMLKSNNGLMNTLATDGADKFDFTVQNDGNDVILKTTITTATIIGTLIAEQPLAIYSIDKVLLPKELFKDAPTPAPAPAPENADDSLKSDVHKGVADEPSDSPADAPADDTADSTPHNKKKNAGVALDCRRPLAMALSLCLGFLVL